jgi:hypothetical protein
MTREDDEKLWDLLGRPALPEVSPFFARNVLRRVRERPRWALAGRSWLDWRRLAPASAVVAVIVATFFAYTFSFHPKPDPEDETIAKIDAQDYEVVADLDELMASDETNLWDENSSL